MLNVNNQLKLINNSLLSFFDFKQGEPRKFEKFSFFNYMLFTFTIGYHLLTALILRLDFYQFRAIHVLLFAMIILLNYPIFKKMNPKKSLLIDFVLICFSIFALGYAVINYYEIQMRIPYITQVTNLEVVVGIIAILIVLETTRRISGPILPIIAIIVFVYAFISPASVGRGSMTIKLFVERLYLFAEGMFGLPTAVSAKYIVNFVSLAVLLSVTGLDKLIMNISYLMAKRSKAATVQLPVIASALMGSIVGSSTANAVATGSITIPLLKRFGFSSNFAAAIVASASVGGLFLPPVMGAVAFVMAELTNIPYIIIAYHAAVPALLYYFAIGFAVHLRAKNQRIFDNFDENEINNLKKQIGKIKYYHYYVVLSPLLLIYLLVIGKSPMLAAAYSLIMGLIISQFRKGFKWRLGFLKEFISKAALTSAHVVPTLVCAGMIVTGIEMAGLDAQLVFLIQRFSSNLYLALFLAALLSIILGMGMPIIAAYIVQVGIIAPILIQFGLSPLQAHLYLIFFAAVSMITPPVAITAYAAAGIAHANAFKTAMLAFRLGFASYIIPFMFALSPAVLLVGDIKNIVLVIFFIMVGIICLSIMFEGWFTKKLGVKERFLFLLSGILALYFPLFGYLWLSVVGVILFIIIVYFLLHSKVMKVLKASS